MWQLPPPYLLHRAQSSEQPQAFLRPKRPKPRICKAWRDSCKAKGQHVQPVLSRKLLLDQILEIHINLLEQGPQSSNPRQHPSYLFSPCCFEFFSIGCQQLVGRFHIKFQVFLEISEELATLGPHSPKAAILGSWVTAAPSRQGTGSPVCHSPIPPEILIYISYLPCGRLVLWPAPLLHTIHECACVCVCLCVHAHACAGGGYELEDICWESLRTQECFKRWRRALAAPMKLFLDK